MDIRRNTDVASVKGSSEWFTGNVRIDSLTQPKAPSRTSVGIPTFEPGARTKWHTHPLGQLLIVTSGEGWVQIEGGPKEVVRPGDIVWFEPGEKHWHGASANKAMTHVAITEIKDDSGTDWMEAVTDADYAG